MPKLSTHVLDTSIGKPAAGVNIELFVLGPAGSKLIKSVLTNTDGRTDELLLDADTIQSGDYEIVFHVGDYFAGSNPSVSYTSGAKPDSTSKPFLNLVPIRFTIEDAGENFHVPLLVTPWSYSTYRGS
jgi:5-hydroxyisourate hydrolase